MFAMSVNEVPGWLVTMAPRAIGVPVAWTPGLVPHCEVLTALVLAGALAVLVAVLAALVVLVLLVELELELLQPAAAMAMAAASTIVLRASMAFGICGLISPPLWWRVSRKLTVTTIFIASGGRFMANSNASAARVSGK
jgi:hypothetical protein